MHHVRNRKKHDHSHEREYTIIDGLTIILLSNSFLVSFVIYIIAYRIDDTLLSADKALLLSFNIFIFCYGIMHLIYTYINKRNLEKNKYKLNLIIIYIGTFVEFVVIILFFFIDEVEYFFPLNFFIIIIIDTYGYINSIKNKHNMKIN
jgi:hypothetical protein